MTRTSLRPDHLKIKGDPTATIRSGQSINVILDEGFTCTGSGRTILTYDSARDDWWFACKSGRHLISGQFDGERYIGIYLDD